MRNPRVWVSAVIGLFLNAGVVNAAGVPVWEPTSGSLTTFELDLGEFIGLGRDFAIFDNDDLGTFANPLNLDMGAIALTTVSTVQNVDNSWTFTNTGTGDSLLVGQPGAFIFGYTADGGSTWSAEADSWYLSTLFPDTWIIKYAFEPGVFKTAKLKVKNVVPSAVPVPAAVWLFGSGLLGLVGVARRRH